PSCVATGNHVATGIAVAENVDLALPVEVLQDRVFYRLAGLVDLVVNHGPDALAPRVLPPDPLLARLGQPVRFTANPWEVQPSKPGDVRIDRLCLAAEDLGEETHELPPFRGRYRTVACLLTAHVGAFVPSPLQAPSAGQPLHPGAKYFFSPAVA